MWDSIAILKTFVLLVLQKFNLILAKLIADSFYKSNLDCYLNSIKASILFIELLNASSNIDWAHVLSALSMYYDI